MPLLGYLITFHTYGSWLYGRDQGSVDDEHNTPGTPLVAPDLRREEQERRAMQGSPIELDAERRFVVDATIREVCEYRRWSLHAQNVRSTHVHVVVSAPHSPERVMNDLKGYATRRMREACVIRRDIEPWAFHGSTRYLNTQNSFDRAVQYVLNEQGDALEMRCPSGWAQPKTGQPKR